MKKLICLTSICVALFGVLRTNSQAGIIPTFINQSAELQVLSDEYQHGRYRTNFNIEAEGGDVFLNNYLDFEMEQPSGQLFNRIVGYVLESGTAETVTNASGNQYYLIQEGTTESFSFVAVARPEATTHIRMDINGIRWNSEPSIEILSDGTFSGNLEAVGWPSTDYVLVQGSIVPEPASALLVLIGGLGIASIRRRS